MLYLVMRYWHPYELKHVMREVAAHYPKTYLKLRSLLASQGFNVDPDRQTVDTPDDCYRMFVSIIAAMPRYVRPWRQMGDDRTWDQINWNSYLEDLKQGV